MKKDYRYVLGHFDADGHFEGESVIHRTSQGDAQGAFSCQQLPDGSQEWFVTLGWPTRRSVSSQVFHLTRTQQAPLSDEQLESVTRGPDGMLYLVEA